MNTTIEKFVSDKNVALIGVSLDKNKFGNYLLHELTKNGYTVFPVHPTMTEIEGITCFPDVKTLPDYVSNLILVVNPVVTEQLVSQLNDSLIQRVWMHRGVGKGSASMGAIGAFKAIGIEVVHGFCPMMFFSPSGVHRLHFWLRKNFGKVPVEFIQ
jgi:hypothetical protein